MDGLGGVVGVRGGRAIQEVSGSFQGEWIEDGEKKVGVSTGTVPETIVMTKAILHLRLGGTDPATRAFPFGGNSHHHILRFTSQIGAYPINCAFSANSLTSYLSLIFCAWLVKCPLTRSEGLAWPSAV